MSCSSQADSPTAMARAAATERTLTEERMGIPFSRAGDSESVHPARALFHGEPTQGSAPRLRPPASQKSQSSSWVASAVPMT